MDDRLRSVASRVELMVGRTKNDAGAFLQMTWVAGHLNHLGPLASPARHIADDALTQVVFSRAIAKFVDHWRAFGGKAITYRFDWAPHGSKLGACHCIELPYDRSPTPPVRFEHTRVRSAALVVRMCRSGGLEPVLDGRFGVPRRA
jgi:hypothetical protein